MSDDKKPLPVSGARIGSLARPVPDGAATGYGIAKPRFGLRTNTSKLRLGPPPKPDSEVGSGQ